MQRYEWSFTADKRQWPTSTLATEQSSMSPEDKDLSTHKHSKRGRTRSQSHQNALLKTPLATVHQQSWRTRPWGAHRALPAESHAACGGSSPPGGQEQHLIPLDKRNSNQKSFCRRNLEGTGGEFTYNLRKKSYWSCTWHFQGEGPLPNSLHAETLIWMPKPDKQHQKNYSLTSLMNVNTEVLNKIPNLRH